MMINLVTKVSFKKSLLLPIVADEAMAALLTSVSSALELSKVLSYPDVRVLAACVLMF